MSRFSGYRADIALAIFLTGILTAHLYLLPLVSARPLILIAAALIGVIPVFIRALHALQKREWASMDMLASFALIFSIISRAWVSVIFVELMLAGARIFDDLTRDRTEASIRSILKLRPSTVAVEREGVLTTIPLAQLRAGDRAVVGVGEHIPADGIIVSGSGAIDESSLTGESIPVDKSVGARVMSATLVASGGITIAITHTGKDTTVERIIALVETARAEKPSPQTLGEQFGKRYLIAMFFGSLIILLITRNVSLVLAVVLVVCADDIAIAIPLAYLRAINTAARHGIIVKGGRHLELMGKIDTVIFDKTGTLTTGTLGITSVVPVHGYDEDAIVRIGVIAAQRSSHPFSRALVTHANMRNIHVRAPDNAREYGGKGVVANMAGSTFAFGRAALFDELGIVIPPELSANANAVVTAQGASIAYIAQDARTIGFIAAADHVRPHAKKMVASLKALGIAKIILLSGDNAYAAASVARELDIHEWHANLLPEDKVAKIKEIQAHHPVAMVGDGVNDAAALSIAAVGIAMGGLGTEGSIESAQIVLMRDDLSMLPRIIMLARMAQRISLQDFAIWGITNATGLILVFSGIIGPTGAAIYNFLSDFLPLSNSMRVKIQR